jgi:hypothetical protein
MNAIILKGAALRFHKVAPEPKQLPTPDLVASLLVTSRVVLSSIALVR